MKQFNHYTMEPAMESYRKRGYCEPLFCGAFEFKEGEGDITAYPDFDGWMFKVEFAAHVSGYKQTITLTTYNGRTWQQLTPCNLYKTDKANDNMVSRATAAALRACNECATEQMGLYGAWRDMLAW